MQRKVAVILAADVVGFSRLVAEDEEETLRRLVSYRQVFEDFVGQYGGRIFNTAGDAVLAEFRSSVDAVRAAIDIQETLRTRNFAFPPSRQMLFRIGITVGDVVEREGDLLGDAVNIAARLQALAMPGGIWVSQAIHEQIANKMSVAFRDLGSQPVKNIPTPVHVFAVVPPGQGTQLRHLPDLRRYGWAAGLAGLGIAAVLALATVWSMRESGQQPLEGSGEAGTNKRIFMAEQVPFLREDNRSDLKDNYEPARAHKALALNRFGYAYAVAEPSEGSAREKALANCEASTREPCEIYAMGSTVIWPHPPPAMPPVPWRRDVPGGTEPFDPKRVPFVREADLELIASFRQRPQPRALSMAQSGLIGMSWGGTSVDDPIRRSLEFCGDRAGEPCLLVAVNEAMAAALPRTYDIAGLFRPERDPRLPAKARDTVQATYHAGPEWRALALGDDGFGMAVGRESEEDAIAAALTQCERHSIGCRIYAIGDFRVRAATVRATLPEQPAE